MRELHQPYSEIQIMPFNELVEYSEIIKASMKELEDGIEQSQNQMKSGMDKFRIRH